MAYPLPGDSDEDKALINYIRGSGISNTVTCTTNHSLFSLAGFISYHRRGGTNGNGLAIDVAGPDMKLIFNYFLKQQDKLHELIHTPMGFSVKDGRQVNPIAASSHYNHVHISVSKGTFLVPTAQPTKEYRNMAAADPISGGEWVTDAAGHVFAYDGAPYLSNLTDHPDWHAGSLYGDPCVGISFWKGDGTDSHGNGYALFTQHGTDAPNVYRFDRSGSLKV